MGGDHRDERFTLLHQTADTSEQNSQKNTVLALPVTDSHTGLTRILNRCRRQFHKPGENHPGGQEDPSVCLWSLELSAESVEC